MVDVENGRALPAASAARDDAGYFGTVEPAPLLAALRALQQFTPPRLPKPLAYASAFVSVAIATSLQFIILEKPSLAPFLTFFPFVALTAWLAGPGPGLLSVLLSALVTNYLFIDPYDAWSLSTPALVASAWFIVSSSVVAMLCSAFRGAFLELERLAAEQRHTAAALLKSEHESAERDARFKAIFLNSNEAIALLDPETGSYVDCNRQMERMSEFSHDQLVGMKMNDLVAERCIDEVPRTLASITGTPSLRGEMEMRTATGGVLPVELHSSVVPIGDKNMLVSFLHDISDRKRMEQALLEAHRRKDEFLAVLSHELRNPLTPIRNGLYILERSAPHDPQAQRALAIIGRQVDQLTKLVDDLLDVTRISRGKIRLQRTRFSLTDLARRTAEDYQDMIVGCGLELELNVSDKPIWINGDSARFAQVIGNLLHNATKFTAMGGHVFLAVTEDALQRVAVIRVRDDGAGIHSEVLERLFLPFEQAEATLDRNRGGLGLGLALARAMVELHGGTIAAISAGEGLGAEFVVTLPLDEAREAPVDDAARPHVTVPRRVLIIEDNIDVAQTLQDLLALDNHEVEVAHDGPTGLMRAREFKPEVIVCDIGLPDMDGFHVARALRSDEILKDVFLVALSGYALPEDLKRAAEAGFDQHIAKPLTAQKLEQMLTSAPMPTSA